MHGGERLFRLVWVSLKEAPEAMLVKVDTMNNFQPCRYAFHLAVVTFYPIEKHLTGEPSLALGEVAGGMAPDELISSSTPSADK
jgi:hypothetical protein